MWDDLTRKYCFKGMLTLRTALHIGGGNVNTSHTDSPVVRTPEGIPYIPGSSLKGVLRSRVEQIASALPQVTTCQLVDKEVDCLTPDEKIFAAWKNDHKNYTEGELAQYLQEHLCSTCKLFGSPYARSKVTVHDLMVKDWAEVTQVRDGVVIDRDSERARDRLKYDYEVVPPGAEFELEIWLENPEDRDLALACVGINELRSGMVHIGGNTSRGLGSCQIRTLNIYELDLTGADRNERLKNYLIGTTVDTKLLPISDVDRFLEERIVTLLL